MRINQEYLRESVEVYNPIPRFNGCMTKPTFRIGEHFRVSYDYDLVVKKLEKTGKATPETAQEYIEKHYDSENNSFIKFVDEDRRNREYISLVDEEMLFCDGFDAALVGYRIGFGTDKNIAAYDYGKCVQCLVNEGMEEDDAFEFLEYNTVGSYVGEYTPCFLHEF
jgi:hypothetical protein